MKREKSTTSLFNRVLISVIGIPAILALIYAGNYWFTTFIAVAVFLCTHEFLKLFNFPSKTVAAFIVILNTAVTYLVFLTHLEWLIIPFLGGWTVIALWLMIQYPIGVFDKAFIALSSMIYPGLALTGMVLVREFSLRIGEDYFLGAKILYLTMAMIWICDTLAYFFGSAYGTVKFSPKVSPNKTWEGAIAGFLGSVIVALVANRYNLIPLFNTVDYLILAVIAGVLGQLGDLVESTVKRFAGVKDTSRLLLDHGGALDRLDSLAFTVPVIYIFLVMRFA